MPESRQLRIAELETQKTRCRRSLAELRFDPTIPYRMPKDSIPTLIQKIETELRQIEDELHDLYVQRIREESHSTQQDDQQ